MPEIFESTKRYGHDIGLSCAFRQWRATHSHCSLVHGYSLAFRFVFGCSQLNELNWVADYGNFKDLKASLVEQFDHKTVIARDDPELEWFREANFRGILDLRIVDAVGTEMFAKMGFISAQQVVTQKFPDGRVWVISCECSEHGANSAIYKGNHSNVVMDIQED